MSRSRAPLAIGLTAAAGIGYYLYGAGGNARVAEKQFEADVHRGAAKVKGELPHRGVGAEANAKDFGAEAGAKVDSAVSQTKAEYEKAKSNAEAYAKEAKANTMKKIDDFDKKVEDKAAQAKGGISSWFGGK